MPIGLVNDSEFEAELNRGTPAPIQPNENAAIIIDNRRPGRKDGDMNVPEVLRKVIGETGAIDGHNAARQLASMFSVSPSSVSAYTNGSHSTSSYHTQEKDLNNHLRNAKQKVANRARAKLNKAFNHITEDKMKDAKLTDLAVFAKSMSGIIKDMEPDKPDQAGINVNGPSIIMYNPGFAKEESFDVIDVSNEAN